MASHHQACNRPLAHPCPSPSPLLRCIHLGSKHQCQDRTRSPPFMVAVLACLSDTSLEVMLARPHVSIPSECCMPLHRQRSWEFTRMRAFILVTLQAHARVSESRQPRATDPTPLANLNVMHSTRTDCSMRCSGTSAIDAAARFFCWMSPAPRPSVHEVHNRNAIQHSDTR